MCDVLAESVEPMMLKHSWVENFRELYHSLNRVILGSQTVLNEHQVSHIKR